MIFVGFQNLIPQKFPAMIQGFFEGIIFHKKLLKLLFVNINIAKKQSNFELVNFTAKNNYFAIFVNYFKIMD